MIVKMKKITMIVPQKDQGDFLVKLRKEGVVHIKHLAEPSSSSLEIMLLDEEKSQLEKAVFILTQYHARKQKPQLGDKEMLEEAQKIINAKQKSDELKRNIDDTINKMGWYKHWGAFNPKDLIELKNRGIYIKLYRLNKNEFKKIKQQENIYVVTKGVGYFYIIGLFKNENEGLDYEEIRPPVDSYNKLKERLELYNKEYVETEKFLYEQAGFRRELEDFLQRLQRKHTFLSVFFGMKKDEILAILQGFCPVPELNKVTSLAKSNGVGYLIEDPIDSDATPTLIRNPRWINIIHPVFSFMNTIPGYNEFDISLVFLVFFSLFFAMLIGDAGYGLIFLGITWFARRKFKNVPKEPFLLMYLLSFTTIIWGAITGTWFGFAQIAKLPFLSSLVINKINSFATDNQNSMIYLCFVIGIIHLTIAHIMRFIKFINSPKALAQLGWLSTVWGLFFLAGTLVIGKPFPSFAKYLILGGIVTVLIFANFQKNIIKGVLNSLIDTPLAAISSFGDIISYIRLFAVGYASVAVATSFNSMALKAGFSNIIIGLCAALILFFGHALNITLGLMAVIVHGIRLNMLEFSGHLGMEWSGNNYKPFTEK